MSGEGRGERGEESGSDSCGLKECRGADLAEARRAKEYRGKGEEGVR